MSYINSVSSIVNAENTLMKTVHTAVTLHLYAHCKKPLSSYVANMGVNDDVFI